MNGASITKAVKTDSSDKSDRLLATPLGRSATGLAALILLFTGCGGASSAAEQQAAGAAESNNLNGRCDAAIAAAPIAHVSEDALAPHTRWRLVLDDRIGRVNDVEWKEQEHVFVVLDAMNEQVATVDTIGRRIGAFGRAGQGPGEFAFAGKPNLAGNRLLLLDDSTIVVSDLRSTKLFATTGRYLRQIATDSLPESYNADFHSALGVDGKILLSSSGKFHLHSQDSLERISLWIKELDPGIPPRVRLVATARNSWAQYPRFARYPEHRPYRDEYRRVWDARRALLAIYPWKAYGVCFFTTDGQLEAAYRVDAPRLRVDAAERERVLRAAFGGGEQRLPFLGVTGEELFRDKWPRDGPYYTDILLSDDDEAWLARRVNGGRIMVDVFSRRSGYRGSFTPPGDRLPRRVADGLAMTPLWDDSVELLVYSLQPAVPSE